MSCVYKSRISYRSRGQIVKSHIVFTHTACLLMHITSTFSYRNNWVSKNWIYSVILIFTLLFEVFQKHSSFPVHLLCELLFTLYKCNRHQFTSNVKNVYIYFPPTHPYIEGLLSLKRKVYPDFKTIKALPRCYRHFNPLIWANGQWI